MEKYANNMKRRYLVFGQSSWLPARAQLVFLPISASTLAPAPPVFLRLQPGPPYHIQTPSWGGLRATLPLTVTVIVIENATENATETVKEVSSNVRGSATESVNARPRNVSVNAKETEIVNNASPKGSNRIESRAIGLVGVHLNTLLCIPIVIS